MAISICLLACALTTGQVLERGDWQLAPRLARGLELTYAGTCTEESLIPKVQFQRQYRLQTTLFVLDATKKHADVAIMTSLGLRDQRDGVVTASHSSAGSVRLEVARVDPQGRVSTPDGKAHSLSVR